MSNSNTRPHLALVLLFLALLLVTLTVEVTTVGMFMKAQRAASWPTASGTITRSELSERFNGTRRVFEANISYEFSVNGREYASSSLRTRGASTAYQSDVNVLIGRFPVGANVPVYYDPRNPSESYLVVGADVVNYIIIVSPLVFALGFGGAFLRLAKRRWSRA